MAKAQNKKVDNTNRASYEVHIATKEDKMIKPNGITHTLTDFWFAPGYKAPLLSGSTFVECNDGWYIVYNSLGVRMPYRVSGKVIETVFEAEATVAI